MVDTPKSQDRLRDKLTETRENIVDMGHLAKEAVQDKLHDLKDRAAASYGEGKEKLHDFEQDFVRRVRESPIKALLIAAGSGLLLGLFCRRG